MSAKPRRPSTNDGDALDIAGARTVPLYIVRVHDRVDERIAGHDDRLYASPPAPHGSALALVGLLLGGAARPVNGAGVTRAVPGGQRTITLTPEGPASP